MLRFIRAEERERQQIKWLTYGTAIMAMLIIGGFLVINDPDSPIVGLIFSLAIMLLPLSIGISILRNQLYDIDRLINRTLVYGILTILLALVYFALVFGLQALARLITGQISQTPVVVVVSTLVIAALFQPLRRRIQKIIDRRFYRSKYDAAKIIANFSSTLRDEVDLNTLTEHLVAVVQETMQPAHVSLWLRKAEQRKQPDVEGEDHFICQTSLSSQSMPMTMSGSHNSFTSNGAATRSSLVASSTIPKIYLAL